MHASKRRECLSCPQAPAPATGLALSTALAAALLTAACGSGGGGSGTSTPPAPPIIQAILIAFPDAGIPPGILPAGSNCAVSVTVTDSSSNSVITSATGTINGTALSYVAANQDYEASITIEPGATVSLEIDNGGTAYTTSAVQPASYPAIYGPQSGGTWAASGANIVSWSLASTPANAQILVGTVSAAHPAGSLTWPANNNFQSVPTTSSAFVIPANSLTAGSGLFLVGITEVQLGINGAVGNSGVALSGFTYTQFNVIATPTATLNSVAVSPQDPTVAVGSTQRFLAIGTYSDASTLDLTGQVTWMSLTPSTATIDSTGLLTAVASGTSQIDAVSTTVGGNTLVTVP